MIRSYKGVTIKKGTWFAEWYTISHNKKYFRKIKYRPWKVVVQADVDKFKKHLIVRSKSPFYEFSKYDRWAVWAGLADLVEDSFEVGDRCAASRFFKGVSGRMVLLQLHPTTSFPKERGRVATFYADCDLPE